MPTFGTRAHVQNCWGWCDGVTTLWLEKTLLYLIWRGSSRARFCSTHTRVVVSLTSLRNERFQLFSRCSATARYFVGKYQRSESISLKSFVSSVFTASNNLNFFPSQITPNWCDLRRQVYTGFCWNNHDSYPFCSSVSSYRHSKFKTSNIFRVIRTLHNFYAITANWTFSIQFKRRINNCANAAQGHKKTVAAS